ncbi:cryptochrome/photolyase family protein [Pseudonocardia spinosispora]|uniref:cryptochrome/photolyase family protein n=1 Tax=Pseudonocardia spinosispora TaxID=103441 RepID=UPI000405FAE4|nr:deoxyribodipyrimidine photo-lyase [Pseudonocardia spinosispora]
MDTAVVWFRRDLRLNDHAALLAAADAAGSALALFVLDEHLLGPSGAPRTAFLAGCLRALDESLDGRLLVRRGDPVTVVPEVAREIGARTVHISADAGPYGRERDARVAKQLRSHDVELVTTGSPYAVTPGRVRKADGEPYRVFTPFKRAWLEHGWRAPADTSADTLTWLSPPSGGRAELPSVDCAMELPEPGEQAAQAAWRRFTGNALADYDHARDRPGIDGTSRLSAYLHFGCLHPRTLLADLPEGVSAETFRSELAWRDFYADVLWHRPRTARYNADRRFDQMPWDSGDEADALFDAWCAGRTGYPIVDAGMRQLLAEGWMHNRVRMIVASFLVKDLHLPWWRGARHFMRNLVDGDLASNQHGWQWTAGSGTDAAPYFRIFNPTSQGERFDPDGEYVRRYVPELREVSGRAVHQPWKLRTSVEGYPEPIVDHAAERKESLARYEFVKTGSA